jgi:hypothetical protein
MRRIKPALHSEGKKKSTAWRRQTARLLTIGGKHGLRTRKVTESCWREGKESTRMTSVNTCHVFES